MGCDIHLYGEVKINGVWRHWSNPSVPRNYKLFGRMAGVRDDSVEPIAAPRGIPDDATFETRFDHDEFGDGHTPSWLSGVEIDQLERDSHNSFGGQSFWNLCHHAIGYIFGNGWNVQKYPRDYPQGVEEARIVFWFDN